MIGTDDVFKIGTIQRPHGINGAVDMRFTDDVFDRCECDYLFLQIDGLFVPFFIEEYRFKNNEVAIMKFEWVHNEVAARRICGKDVFFPLSEVTERTEAPVTWNFLTGFAVSDKSTDEIGVIQSVDSSNANILLNVRRKDGTEVLLPLHTDFVLECDEQRRRLLLSLPDGLLSLND